MSCCCCCCNDSLSEASALQLKRELRQRYSEQIDNFALAFFDELRRDLREGRIDDALLLMDRVERPTGGRCITDSMVAFA